MMVDDGSTVDDVELPSWASSPEEFVRQVHQSVQQLTSVKYYNMLVVYIVPSVHFYAEPCLVSKVCASQIPGGASHVINTAYSTILLLGKFKLVRRSP